MNNQVLIFSDELKAFENHLNTIQSQIQEQQKRLGNAVEGDPNGWHDNFDFEDARREIGRLNDMYGKQRKIIEHARVLTLQTLTNNTDTIRLGSIVTLFINNKEHIFTIGGYDTKIAGRLAYNSPLGKAIFSKKKGDSIEYLMGKEIKKVEIKDVA